MFYSRLREVCDSKDIKLTNLVTELGMSQGNLSKWKKGGMPKADTLARIAEKLGVSVSYLVEDSENIEKAPTPGTSVEAMYIAELANSLPDQKRKEAVAYLLALQKEADSEKQ